jgi:hypothetical protein
MFTPSRQSPHVATTFPGVLALLGIMITATGAQESRIEAARQINAAGLTSTATRGPVDSSLTAAAAAATDDAPFGTQTFLKEPERLRPFRAFADISAFITNNVALTRQDATDDAFLLATFGFEYRQPIGNGWQLEADARYASFRYNEYRELDFDSLDAGLGANYHSDRLGGVDFFVRYNCNQLTAPGGDDTFFTNHTFSAGAQKVIALGQTHAIFFGAAGQLASADPEVSERSELAGYAGYHLQATSELGADLLYRYAYQDYAVQNRADHNHTVSLSVSYTFADWGQISASSFAAWNRSDQEAFNYDAANAGGGLTLSLRF